MIGIEVHADIFCLEFWQLFQQYVYKSWSSLFCFRTKLALSERHNVRSMILDLEQTDELLRLKEWVAALKECSFKSFRCRTIKNSELEILSLRVKHFEFFNVPQAV